jgi:hypothetical protein
MSKLIAAAQSPASGFMPLLGPASAFVALVIVGFAGGVSVIMSMAM